MKIGVRAHDFGRMSAKNLANTVKNAGFDCVQLAFTKAIEGINHFNDITTKHLEEAAEAFNQADLEISVYGCYVEPSYTDTTNRLQQVGYFIDGIANAKRLGVPVIGTETTHFNINATTAEREVVYKLLKDSVLRMVEVAEKEDVIIGIEPVAEHTLNTPQLTRRLLDEVGSDKLKIIFDPVNLVLPDTIDQQATIFNEMFNLLGNDIVAMHIKDIVIENGEKVWRKIGDGVIDYNGLIIPWLKENKPDMRLLREGVMLDSYSDDKKSMQVWL